MTNIERTEWDDLDHALAKHNRKRDEFDFAEMESKAIHTGIEPALGTITITLPDTRETKTYKTGHGSAWVVEFDDDLKAGFFKA